MDEEPAPLNPAIKAALGAALVPMFGANLDAFYAEQERHDTETRELIDRARRVTQELLNDALKRLTFFGGDRAAYLGEAHEITRAQREGVDVELREALAEAMARHRRKVEALRIIPDEDSPAQDAEGDEGQGEEEE